jgi:hypothetical protein
MQMNVDKLKKMAGAVRTGGKGSMRRCLFFYCIYSRRRVNSSAELYFLFSVFKKVLLGARLRALML